MMLADFHVHSTFSDGKMTIPAVIDLYGQRGFGAIAITDHVGESQTVIGKAAGHLGLCLTPATFPLYLEILKSEAERAWKQYKMVVIPGVELSKNSISNHRSAHILALGIEEFISADGDVADIAKEIRKTKINDRVFEIPEDYEQKSARQFKSEIDEFLGDRSEGADM